MGLGLDSGPGGERLDIPRRRLAVPGPGGHPVVGLQVFGRGLNRHGIDVEHASDGATGIERLKQGGIDVVALDQHMPGLDGLATLEQIYRLPMATPPIVFVTASEDSQIAIAAVFARVLFRMTRVNTEAANQAALKISATPTSQRFSSGT